MIYLRTVCDDSGDVVDYRWFCSEGCYNDHVGQNPSTRNLELGGAYPLGAEHDSPDYCATCSEPVGNPLTTDGEIYVCEYVARVDAESHGPSADLEGIERAVRLRAEYPYLWHPDTGQAIHD